MENVDVGNELLKKKYHLEKSPEVMAAAKRHEARTGEPTPEDPLSKIQIYLNRLP